MHCASKFFISVSVKCSCWTGRSAAPQNSICQFALEFLRLPPLFDNSIAFCRNSDQIWSEPKFDIFIYLCHSRFKISLRKPLNLEYSRFKFLLFENLNLEYSRFKILLFENLDLEYSRFKILLFENLDLEYSRFKTLLFENLNLEYSRSEIWSQYSTLRA